MQKQLRVQQKLKEFFPEFRDKKLLLDYYVGFDFPEKQMKMVKFWQNVIDFIIQSEGQLYISHRDLIDYVSIYNLKPTPLEALLHHYRQQHIFEEENAMMNCKKMPNQTQNKSWVQNMYSYVFGSKVSEEIFKFQQGDKIFSKKLKQKKKIMAKAQFPKIFSTHLNSLGFYKCCEQLSLRIGIDIDSCNQILKQLSLEKTIIMEQGRNQKIIMYSQHNSKLVSKEWKQLQAMKFCLRQQIDRFEFLIKNEEEKILKEKERAKEYAMNQNMKSAKAILKGVVQYEKKTANIRTRKMVLQNQLTSLQYNEMNKSSIELMEQAQKIYKETMIDPAKMDEIMDKNMEIEIDRKEMDRKFQSQVNDQEDEEDVDKMMEELQQQINNKKTVEKKTVKVQIEQPMEIEKNQNYEKQEEKMIIE